LVVPLSKLCLTPQSSIQDGCHYKKIEISLNGKTTGLEFKCQIENQASYYSLLNITGS
jgi:hypothetical protein